MLELTPPNVDSISSGLISNLIWFPIQVVITMLAFWLFKKKNVTVICFLGILITVFLGIIFFKYDIYLLAATNVFLSGMFGAILLVLWWLGLWTLPGVACMKVMAFIRLARITESLDSSRPASLDGLREIVEICNKRECNKDILPLLRMRQTPQTRKHLLALYEILHPIHPGAQPLFAYIANESAQHLKSERGANTGEDISDEKYVRLLKDSVNYENLEDVTFIDTIPPQGWGDPVTRNGDQAKMAWDYFDAQRVRKADKNKPVRMRRLLLMDMENWKKDPCADKFLEMHKNAKIDLSLLPRTSLTENHKIMATDLAIFFGRNQCSWMIWSDLDNDKLALRLFHAGIVFEEGTIHAKYSTFLNDAFKVYLNPPNYAHLLLTSDSSNEPPVDFLKVHQIL